MSVNYLIMRVTLGTVTFTLVTLAPAVPLFSYYILMYYGRVYGTYYV